MEMSESPTDLVDGVRSKYMRVPRHGLVGLGGLKALIKGTAVRDATEDTRDKDGVIGIAEPDKDLFLVVGVHVAANIELVAMLEQTGA